MRGISYIQCNGLSNLLYDKPMSRMTTCICNFIISMDSNNMVSMCLQVCFTWCSPTRAGSCWFLFFTLAQNPVLSGPPSCQLHLNSPSTLGGELCEMKTFAMLIAKLQNNQTSSTASLIPGWFLSEFDTGMVFAQLLVPTSLGSLKPFYCLTWQPIGHCQKF